MTKCTPCTFFSNILEVLFEKLIFEKLLHGGRWLGLPFCLLVHKESPFCSSRHFNLILRRVPPWEEHGWGYHVVSYLGKSFSPRTHPVWKNCPKICFFIHFVHGKKRKIWKRIELCTLGWRGRFWPLDHFFSLKNLCKKYN